MAKSGVSAAVTLSGQNVDELITRAKSLGSSSVRVSLRGTVDEIRSAIVNLSTKGKVASAVVSLRFSPS